jgi:hypothetical protein
MAALDVEEAEEDVLVVDDDGSDGASSSDESFDREVEAVLSRAAAAIEVSRPAVAVAVAAAKPGSAASGPGSARPPLSGRVGSSGTARPASAVRGRPESALGSGRPPSAGLSREAARSTPTASPRSGYGGVSEPAAGAGIGGAATGVGGALPRKLYDPANISKAVPENDAPTAAATNTTTDYSDDDKYDDDEEDGEEGGNNGVSYTNSSSRRTSKGQLNDDDHDEVAAASPAAGEEEAFQEEEASEEEENTNINSNQPGSSDRSGGSRGPTKSPSYDGDDGFESASEVEDARSPHSPAAKSARSGSASGSGDEPHDSEEYSEAGSPVASPSRASGSPHSPLPPRSQTELASSARQRSPRSARSGSSTKSSPRASSSAAGGAVVADASLAPSATTATKSTGSLAPPAPLIRVKSMNAGDVVAGSRQIAAGDMELPPKRPAAGKLAVKVSSTTKPSRPAAAAAGARAAARDIAARAAAERPSSGAPPLRPASSTGEQPSAPIRARPASAVPSASRARPASATPTAAGSSSSSSGGGGGGGGGGSGRPSSASTAPKVSAALPDKARPSSARPRARPSSATTSARPTSASASHHPAGRPQRPRSASPASRAASPARSVAAAAADVDKLKAQNRNLKAEVRKLKRQQVLASHESGTPSWPYQVPVAAPVDLTAAQSPSRPTSPLCERVMTPEERELWRRSRAPREGQPKRSRVDKAELARRAQLLREVLWDSSWSKSPAHSAAAAAAALIAGAAPAGGGAPLDKAGRSSSGGGGGGSGSGSSNNKNSGSAKCGGSNKGCASRPVPSSVSREQLMRAYMGGVALSAASGGPPRALKLVRKLAKRLRRGKKGNRARSNKVLPDAEIATQIDAFQREQRALEERHPESRGQDEQAHHAESPRENAIVDWTTTELFLQSAERLRLASQSTAQMDHLLAAVDNPKALPRSFAASVEQLEQLWAELRSRRGDREVFRANYALECSTNNYARVLAQVTRLTTLRNKLLHAFELIKRRERLVCALAKVLDARKPQSAQQVTAAADEMVELRALNDGLLGLVQEIQDELGHPVILHGMSYLHKIRYDLALP